MLSIWLSLHCLEKPTILTRCMEPANCILVLIRALPRPIEFTDSSEPLAVHRSHLFGTAFTGDGLVLIGNVELVRTWDITSHLYFDRPNRRLYIFITGAFCYSQNRFCDSQRVSYKAHWRVPVGEHMRPEVPAPTAIPLNYTQEVSRTLTILFDKTSKGRKIFRDFQKSFRDLKPLMPPMRLRNRRIGLFWTEEGKHSTSNQYLNATNRALGRSTYHLEDFPYFAERLLVLEQYLNEVRPSTFRQLMRDSRDQLQYYTFIVAFVVFILTIVGLILSILQTIASFMQVSLALKQS
ncbi:hypothetical protein BGX38DRAFT_1156204 [Terfezia claveryi]|nr:hypothetical protein BGX38DRAFT_1156204 [Terfezia claveryi]